MGIFARKYDVVTDLSNIKWTEGCRKNIAGFGWTNAVFLELWHELPLDKRGRRQPTYS
jgi:alpha,alpha-trehalase